MTESSVTVKSEDSVAKPVSPTETDSTKASSIPSGDGQAVPTRAGSDKASSEGKLLDQVPPGYTDTDHDKDGANPKKRRKPNEGDTGAGTASEGQQSLSCRSDAAKGGEKGPATRKGVLWSEEEHRLFLLGLAKWGKGNWRLIARDFIRTRTPSQVASHAQKFYQRQQLLRSGHRLRPSIHDINTFTPPYPQHGSALGHIWNPNAIGAGAGAGAGAAPNGMGSTTVGYGKPAAQQHAMYGMPPVSTGQSSHQPPPPQQQQHINMDGRSPSHMVPVAMYANGTQSVFPGAATGAAPGAHAGYPATTSNHGSGGAGPSSTIAQYGQGNPTQVSIQAGQQQLAPPYSSRAGHPQPAGHVQSHHQTSSMPGYGAKLEFPAAPVYPPNSASAMMHNRSGTMDRHSTMAAPSSATQTARGPSEAQYDIGSLLAEIDSLKRTNSELFTENQQLKSRLATATNSLQQHQHQAPRPHPQQQSQSLHRRSSTDVVEALEDMRRMPSSEPSAMTKPQ